VKKYIKAIDFIKLKMKIVVFTDQIPSDSDNALIAKFENSGHRVLVDAFHKIQISWIRDNYKETPHRIYYAELTELYDGIVQDLDEKSPFSFIVHFNVDEKINNADWVYIRLYLKAVLYDQKIPRLTRRLSAMINDKHVEQRLCLDPIMEGDDMEMEGEGEAKECYSFNKAVFEDRNMALCEIVKPIMVKSNDKLREKVVVEQSVPYTVIIRNFATRGFYPVFWSLFICESWGKDNKDIQFLKALWEDLKMDGEFDMDKIIQTGIDECNWANGEGACAGPEVYRKSLNETLEVLLSKEKGFK
jgi:hypothetical protein